MDCRRRWCRRRALARDDARDDASNQEKNRELRCLLHRCALRISGGSGFRRWRWWWNSLNLRLVGVGRRVSRHDRHRIWRWLAKTTFERDWRRHRQVRVNRGSAFGCAFRFFVVGRQIVRGGRQCGRRSRIRHAGDGTHRGIRLGQAFVASRWLRGGGLVAAACREQQAATKNDCRMMKAHGQSSLSVMTPVSMSTCSIRLEAMRPKVLSSSRYTGSSRA